MEFYKQAAYDNGMYLALSKLGMSMPKGKPPVALGKTPPPIPGDAIAKEKIRRGNHPAQLGANPNSVNPSLRVNV